MSHRELRLYPSCCTSAYCGKCEPACRTCDNREVKDEFTRWCEATAAKCEDPIWCPRVYVATRPDGRVELARDEDPQCSSCGHVESDHKPQIDGTACGAPCHGGRRCYCRRTTT